VVDVFREQHDGGVADQSVDNEPPHSSVVVAESWWAKDFAPARFVELRGWLLMLGFKVTRGFARTSAAGGRFESRMLTAPILGDRHTRRSKVATWVGTVVRGVVRVAGVVGAAACLVVGVFAAPLLLAILVFGTYWKAVKSVDGKVQTALAGSLGDAYAFEHHPLARSTMQQQVTSDLRWLASHGATEIMLIAHSLGAAIAKNVLTNENLRVTRFVTVGSAIDFPGISDQVDEGPLAEPSPEWLDLYTSFDPVHDAGKANPNRTEQPFKSERVSNQQSLFRDHTGYFANEEQFLAPCASWTLKRLAVPPVSHTYCEIQPTVSKLRQDRKNAASSLMYPVTIGVVGLLLLTPLAWARDVTAAALWLVERQRAWIPVSIRTWLHGVVHDSAARSAIGMTLIFAIVMGAYIVIHAHLGTALDRRFQARLRPTPDLLYLRADLLFLAAGFLPAITMGVLLCWSAVRSGADACVRDVGLIAVVVSAVIAAVITVATDVTARLTISNAAFRASDLPENVRAKLKVGPLSRIANGGWSRLACLVCRGETP
jgi:hypothetical protein